MIPDYMKNFSVKGDCCGDVELVCILCDRTPNVFWFEPAYYLSITQLAEIAERHWKKKHA